MAPGGISKSLADSQATPCLPLAAADAPDVSFLAVNPFIYFADYEVELTDAARWVYGFLIGLLGWSAGTDAQAALDLPSAFSARSFPRSA